MPVRRLALWQRAVKCHAGLRQTKKAFDCNEQVLALRPDNRAAQINRKVLIRKMEGGAPS